MDERRQEGDARLREAFDARAGRAVSPDDVRLWRSRLLALARFGVLVPASQGPPLVTQDPQTTFESDPNGS